MVLCRWAECKIPYRAVLENLPMLDATTIASSFDVPAAQNFPANPGRLHNCFPAEIDLQRAWLCSQESPNEAIAGNRYQTDGIILTAASNLVLRMYRTVKSIFSRQGRARVFDGVNDDCPVESSASVLQALRLCSTW